MWQDTINSLYELLGGLFILLSILRVLKDKKVFGVSRLHVFFFVTWGIWNLYYYPHLNQWWSFTGGLFIFLTNSVWLGLILYYGHKVHIPILVSMYDTREALDINGIHLQDIDLVKIATTLSHIGRYGGRSNKYYSVAEHCYYASIWARRYEVDPRLALLHDAAETFIGDVISTYKKDLTIYHIPVTDIENHILKIIFDANNVQPTVEELAQLKKLDKSIRKLECLQLGLKLTTEEAPDPLPGLFLPKIGVNPNRARKMFLIRARELGLLN